VFCDLVIASETIEKGLEEMTYKSYLGNLLVNALEDRHLLLPADRWVRNDFRLVFKNKGSFDNEVDNAGHHADTFDATKLALHALTRAGGPAWVMPGPCGRPPGSTQ
jgi:phage FluMu gp28-like protein